MLLYPTKRAQPKVPHKRSRAGCIQCKEKKKKCNESRPKCSRCIERNLICEYESVKPRKKRRTSLVLSQTGSPPDYNNEPWEGGIDGLRDHNTECFDTAAIDRWDTASVYTYSASDIGNDGARQDQEDAIDADADVEEILRTDGPMPAKSYVQSRTTYMDLATIAPSPMASPLLDFHPPAFAEFSQRRSQRALIDHFCGVLSHLLVFKEDTGNPFQQLVLPLSHVSSPVLNAIFALSSAHLEGRGVESDEKSLDFHNRALQGLARLIEQNERANREEVIGAIMLLVYYEVLVQRGSSNIVIGHLKGALTIMESHSETDSPTSRFLQRAFRFYDVISALSFGTAPISQVPPALSPLSPQSVSKNTPLNSVDTLLGMATDLWPIIHRLANLLDQQREIQAAEASQNTLKASVLRTECEATSNAIELALKNWVLSYPISPHDSNTSSSVQAMDDARMQSILNNAEAYRQAALVYLYRYVKTLPRSSNRVQRHTQLALQACSRVVGWAGPMSALLWPLFISSCEAVDAEHRDLARLTFEGILRRQGMTNIARAWEVVEEVWRKGDTGVQVSWRDICRERGLNIVFG